MIAVPSQDAIQIILRNFLVGVLPAGVEVIAGQVNRVPEPPSPDFVVMWPIARNRLAWNVDSYIDAVFTGSISGVTLNITGVDPSFTGKLGVGIYISGTGIALNTKITALGSGTGGVGTYTVSVSQTVSDEIISAGTAGLLQKTEVVMQCDVHGPNAADNAQVISTAIRDDVATRYFLPDQTGVAPLFAADPRQVPFINGESQVENRWVVDCHLQAQINVVFSQDFADTVAVTPVSVDASFPLT